MKLLNSSDYSLWNDPYFTKGIEILKNFKKLKFEWDFSSSFKIQMHYLFLWIIIERFATFRYEFGKPSARINKLGKNECLIKALTKFVKKRKDDVFDTQTLDKYSLSVDNPGKSIKYYYQLRNNLTHRGKGISRDFYKISVSFGELLNITEYVIDKSKAESEKELNQLTKNASNDNSTD